MTNLDVKKFPIKRALISTSDKSGIVDFASKLVDQSVEILATGGTAKLLKQSGIPVVEVSEYTGFPEIFDGRVKTLHPKIFAGLLARLELDDQLLTELAIPSIDLLVVNLYPFQQTIAQADCSFEDAVEQIDVGGPSMLRAAAKNFARVTVITNPSDYQTVIEEMRQHAGGTTLPTRKALAAKVFIHLTHYDGLIAEYLSENSNQALLPENFNLNFQKKMDLRYGENPQQQAALYVNQISHTLGIARAEALQGKTLSFNNFLDSDCAYRAVYELGNNAACVIVKHATPCGAAIAKDQLSAYLNAYATDPTSAYGGIIALNTPLEKNTAEKILSQQFVEVIIAPGIAHGVKELFEAKPSIRLLICPAPIQTNNELSLHAISGGLLVQQLDAGFTSNWQVVSKRQPNIEELQDLKFAWPIVKYVKSNAIVFARQGMTLGIGGGQTSRVFATKIAALKANEANLSLAGSVIASDAFFPFADSIELAVTYGATAIIQPGGSKRDSEVIEAADESNIAMIFTNQRHFRH